MPWFSASSKRMKVTANPGESIPAERELVIRHQGMRPCIAVSPFKKILHHILQQDLALDTYCLGILLVPDPVMTQVNETFLGHEGSTDVITFDHGMPGADGGLHGELYICPDEARRQAIRFRVHWTEEILRYAIHGILHLLGHDDHEEEDRARMKKEENRLVKQALQRACPPNWERIS